MFKWDFAVYFSLECEFFENPEYFSRVAGGQDSLSKYHPSSVSWKFIKISVSTINSLILFDQRIQR